MKNSAELLNVSVTLYEEKLTFLMQLFFVDFFLFFDFHFVGGVAVRFSAESFQKNHSRGSLPR